MLSFLGDDDARETLHIVKFADSIDDSPEAQKM
jgi:hypothetical protein